MSTLQQKISDNIIAFENKLNQTTPALPISFNRTLAIILAVGQHSFEKAIEKAQLENLIKTATLRESGGKLNDYGEQQVVIYKNATFAILNVRISSLDGVEITPQYSLSGISNGLDYIITESHFATGGYLNFPVTCTVSGNIGNLSIGDTLTLSSPIAGAEQIATVVSIQVIGAEAESIENYRQRILDEIRNPGEAGNLSFYRKRGKRVPGVKNIFPYRGELVGSVFINPGDVTIFVESTTEIDPDGIPTQELLDEVEQNILFDETGEIEIAPTTLRNLHVRPITRSQIYFIITGLAIYDSVRLGDCKNEIEQSLILALLQKNPFISGLDYSREKNDTLTNTNFAGIVDDVAKTYAGKYSAIAFGFSIDAISPDYTLAPWQLVKFGGVQYV